MCQIVFSQMQMGCRIAFLFGSWKPQHHLSFGGFSFLPHLWFCPRGFQCCLVLRNVLLSCSAWVLVLSVHFFLLIWFSARHHVFLHYHAQGLAEGGFRVYVQSVRRRVMAYCCTAIRPIRCQARNVQSEAVGLTALGYSLTKSIFIIVSVYNWS